MNLVIASFTPTGSGLPTFTVETGVSVAGGDAGGPDIVQRMVVLPTGLIYDPDGMDDVPRIPPVVWWDLVFTGAHPYAHIQYYNILGLVGKHGTLVGKLRANTSTYLYSAPARMMKPVGEWRPPYLLGKKNWLEIKIRLQLKSVWSYAGYE